jgi:hypothetical protein
VRERHSGPAMQYSLAHGGDCARIIHVGSRCSGASSDLGQAAVSVFSRDDLSAVVPLRGTKEEASYKSSSSLGTCCAISQTRSSETPGARILLAR